MQIITDENRRCFMAIETKKGRTRRARPCEDVQYFENAGSVSVESTLGMPWTFVTTDSRRFSRASALMRATMSESPASESEWRRFAVISSLGIKSNQKD